MEKGLLTKSEKRKTASRALVPAQAITTPEKGG
jgi:hypothetical protein